MAKLAYMDFGFKKSPLSTINWLPKWINAYWNWDNQIGDQREDNLDPERPSQLNHPKQL